MTKRKKQAKRKAIKMPTRKFEVTITDSKGNQHTHVNILAHSKAAAIKEAILDHADALARGHVAPLRSVKTYEIKIPPRKRTRKRNPVKSEGEYVGYSVFGNKNLYVSNLRGDGGVDWGYTSKPGDALRMTKRMATIFVNEAPHRHITHFGRKTNPVMHGFVITASRPGSPKLFYSGTKFTNASDPEYFKEQSAAVDTARMLLTRFTILRRYQLAVEPKRVKVHLGKK